LTCTPTAFRPIESVPLKSGGTHFLKQELVEVSVCAVGANPNSLLQAKAMGVSTTTIRMIFKEQNKTSRYTEQEKEAITRRAKEMMARGAKGPHAAVKHSTQQEMEANLRKAEAALARAKPKPLNKNATIAERIEASRATDRYNNALRSLRRAREVLTRTRGGQTPREVIRSPKSRSEVVPQKKDHPDQIIWRGQKIPLGWSYSGMRKNWWDPES